MQCQRFYTECHSFFFRRTLLEADASPALADPNLIEQAETEAVRAPVDMLAIAAITADERHFFLLRPERSMRQCGQMGLPSTHPQPASLTSSSVSA